MQPTTPHRTFSIDSNTHHLIFTYCPQHMNIKTIQKHSQKLTQGYFQEETLPQQVKEECEKVKDLFEFLSTQKQTDIQVNGNDFRFKIVRIKKERWYNLNLSVVPSQPKILEGCTISNTMALRQPDLLSSGIEKQELQLENSRLKEKIKHLKKSHRTLKQMLQNKQYEINKMKKTYCDIQLQTSTAMILKNRLNSSNFKPLKLQVSSAFPATAFYSVKNNCIQKISKEPGPLIFKNAINRQARVSFSLSIQSQLHNNWLVFGLMAAQHFNSLFCYCAKNTIAFENNQSVVFVELETLKCEGKLACGDTLQLLVSAEGLLWLINKRVVCAHTVSQQLRNKSLYPFLILSQPGQTVRVNIQQKFQK